MTQAEYQIEIPLSKTMDYLEERIFNKSSEFRDFRFVVDTINNKIDYSFIANLNIEDPGRALDEKLGISMLDSIPVIITRRDN